MNKQRIPSPELLKGKHDPQNTNEHVYTFKTFFKDWFDMELLKSFVEFVTTLFRLCFGVLAARHVGFQDFEQDPTRLPCIDG